MPSLHPSPLGEHLPHICGTWSVLVASGPGQTGGAAWAELQDMFVQGLSGQRRWGQGAAGPSQGFGGVGEKVNRAVGEHPKRQTGQRQEG